jgi:hypothetical protein
MYTYPPNPDQLSMAPQQPFGRVEKHVGFMQAALGNAKTPVAQSTPDFFQLIGKAQLDFDFELHWLFSYNSRTAALTSRNNCFGEESH